MNMKLKALAGAAALVAPFSALAQSALEQISAKKLITIAVPTDFPPYGFVSTDLKPQGLDIDIHSAIEDEPTHAIAVKRQRQAKPHPQLTHELIYSHCVIPRFLHNQHGYSSSQPLAQ